MGTQRVVVARPKDPLEIMLAFVLGFSGVTQLVTGRSSNAISELMPGALRAVWLVLMIAGCIAILAGSYMPGVNGLFLESWGLLTASLAILIYGVSLMWYAYGAEMFTSAAMMTGPTTLALAAGLYWKRIQLQRTIRGLPKL
jgi:membrane-bound ClpP family serine protease